MQRLPLIMTGTAVTGTAFLLVFGMLVSTASAASPINFMNPMLGKVLLCSSVRLVQTDEFGNFDRQGCEDSCRARYGVGPLPYSEEQAWGGRGRDYGAYYLYASCIDACNRQYWRDFDRNMENLKKSE